jgi:hypothetical protein
VPRFERRLRNLETRLTDRSGLLPHTEAWRDYWLIRVDKLIAGEKFDELIPLEFIDALILQGENDAGRR